jgi:plasmid stability protein
MRQLIARIDDDLHRRLKERAAREGRSLNDLVTEALAAAADDESAAFRRRLARSGLRVFPPGPPVPDQRIGPEQGGDDPDDVDDGDLGARDAVLEALLAERDVR